MKNIIIVCIVLMFAVPVFAGETNKQELRLNREKQKTRMFAGKLQTNKQALRLNLEMQKTRKLELRILKREAQDLKKKIINLQTLKEKEDKQKDS